MDLKAFSTSSVSNIMAFSIFAFLNTEFNTVISWGSVLCMAFLESILFIRILWLISFLSLPRINRSNVFPKTGSRLLGLKDAGLPAGLFGFLIGIAKATKFQGSDAFRDMIRTMPPTIGRLFWDHFQQLVGMPSMPGALYGLVPLTIYITSLYPTETD